MDMFRKIINHSKSAFFLAVIFLGLLSSCEVNKLDNSTYIPLNSSSVISVNTEQIFSNAMFDLISNTYLIEGLTGGPFRSLFKDPESAGLVRFDRYYLFGSGDNLTESRLGMILPLSDQEKFSNYLTINFNVEIIKDSIYKIAEVNNNLVIAWDEQTAICLYASVGDDLGNDILDYFVQDSLNSLAEKDKTFSEAINDPSHLVAWFKNDDFLNNLDVIFQSAFSINLLETLKITKEELKGGKSIFSLNFHDGKIIVDSKQYKNKLQLALYKDLEKTNAILPLVNITGSENPVIALSASLNEGGLLGFMKSYDLDKAFSEMLGKYMNFKIDLEFVLNFFAGDAILFVNEFENVRVEKMVQQLNIEGEQEQVVKEIIERRPQITAALSLKKGNQLDVLLKIGARKYLQDDGIYNYDNLVYFTIKDDKLCFTTTPKGVEVLKAFTGKLNPVLKETLTTSKLAASFNLKKTFAFAAEGTPIGKEICEIISNSFNNLLITDQGLNDSGFVSGRAEIEYTSKDHALVSTIKFLDKAIKAMNPIIYEIF